MTDRKERLVAYTCAFYLGDRPCIWHKRHGLLCKCEYFKPLDGHLLIIKLDAMGDVLRTTCILPVIGKAWPGMGTTWITKKESVPLLANNPYLNEVVPFGAEALTHLGSRTFDIVINLDSGKIPSALAAMANCRRKIGYVLHEEGYVMETNQAAGEWLRMGVFDDLKKANKQTYQEIMCSILGLPADGMKYVLELTTREREAGQRRLKELGIDLGKRLIGIHTGGGGRWTLKQWYEDRFVSLIQEIFNENGVDIQVLLMGGPLERDQNHRIKNKVKGPLFDAGCDNDVRTVASLIAQCSVVLSGDSLAMHLALSMGRRVVVLFGPTSNAEIELFGLGEKVTPDLDCVGCYKTSCDIRPNCMESISVDTVKSHLYRQLSILS